MAKKKILYVATVDIHIKSFHLPYLKMMHDKGWEVHVATNGKEEFPYCDKKHTICMERNPFKLNNLKAIKQMKALLNKEHFDIIHCHTPMGSVVTRIAAKQARKNGTRVIYTAHGFHFYTGAPLVNWLLFYPVEKYLAKYTDTLITINKEDYARAKRKFSKRCHDIQYVPGVGIDPKKFDFKMTVKEKHELRTSLGLKDDDFVMIYPARLDKNKNQGFLIECMPNLIEEDPKIHLLLPGPDELNGKYQRRAKELGVENNVHFLGKRDDIPQILKISNLAVSTSKREGLPINILEAAQVGLPILANDARGCEEIVDQISIGKIITTKKETIAEIIKIKNTTKKNSLPDKYTTTSVLKQYNNIYFKKIKVLHLLSSNKYSGAENVACTIINNLADEYEMAYCSPIGDIKKKVEDKGINYLEINKISIKAIKQIIQTYNPDIIHAHDFTASIKASIAGNGKNIISHIHQNTPKVRKINFYSIIYLICTLNIQKIIWVSESAYINYAFNNKVKNKSVILPNIIDTNEILAKTEHSYINDKYDLIYLGRLSKIKNPKKLINIVLEAKKQKPSISLAIVGDGEERNDIEILIKKEKLEKNVRLYGYKNNPYPILKNAKILTMTSVREGTPMAALEAQFLGKPIICTPVDGLKKIIIDGYNGYITNDDKTYSKRILELLNNANYNKFSKNSRNRFKDINNQSRYYSTLRKIYSGTY